MCMGYPTEYLQVKRVTAIAGLVSTVALAYVIGTLANRSSDAGLAAAVLPGTVIGVVLAAYVVWETRTLTAAKQSTEHLAFQLVGKEVALNRFATVDELTGLYTRREFEQFVKIELERFRRHQHPAAILLVEIDEIAQIAGRIGALNKGLLIAELSAILKRILRSIDLGCRYTEDTLAVLLLETNREQASVVASRVREAVTKCEFLRADDGQPGWTVAQGVALFDVSGGNNHSCLRAAEQSLAEARAAGFDQIRIGGTSEDTVMALAA
jgi:diguanylate cyclase (GGDEF)-like protein